MKKTIILLLLFSVSLFGQFRSYDEVVPKTLRTLTINEIKFAINKFAEGESVSNMVRFYGVERRLAKQVFNGIKTIENYAFRCMSGTAIEGVDKVTRTVDLTSMVNLKFSDYINTNEYLLTKMVIYSKSNGSGTWAFYLSQFVEE